MYIPGAGELTIFTSAMAGACIGYLWFNSHPAEIFMGDTGSLSTGAALGTLAILLKKELLLLIIGGVFVWEYFNAPPNENDPSQWAVDIYNVFFNNRWFSFVWRLLNI